MKKIEASSLVDKKEIVDTSPSLDLDGSALLAALDGVATKRGLEACIHDAIEFYKEGEALLSEGQNAEASAGLNKEANAEASIEANKEADKKSSEEASKAPLDKVHEARAKLDATYHAIAMRLADLIYEIVLSRADILDVRYLGLLGLLSRARLEDRRFEHFYALGAGSLLARREDIGDNEGIMLLELATLAKALGGQVKEARRFYVSELLKTSLHCASATLHSEYLRDGGFMSMGLTPELFFSYVRELFASFASLSSFTRRTVLNWVLHCFWNVDALFNHARFLDFEDDLLAAIEELAKDITPDAIDEILYMQFFIYHICGTRYLGEEDWTRFNKKISGLTTKVYEDFARAYNLPRVEPLSGGKKIAIADILACGTKAHSTKAPSSAISDTTTSKCQEDSGSTAVAGGIASKINNSGSAIGAGTKSLKTEDVIASKTSDSPLIKIAILKDRIVDNSPFRVEYSLVQELVSSREFNTRAKITIYNMSLLEKSPDDKYCIMMLDMLGINIVDVYELNKLGFYNSHLKKALYLRERMINDGIDILISPNNGYGISDFLLATRAAPLQVFYSHGNFAYNITGIDARMTHICALQREVCYAGYDFLGIGVAMDPRFYNPPIQPKEMASALIRVAKKMREKGLLDTPDEVLCNLDSSALLSLMPEHILGTIGRYAKIDSTPYLETILNALSSHKDAIYLACGSGNIDNIEAKIEAIVGDDEALREAARRLLFMGFVDSGAFGHIITLWPDSFPMPQGESKLEYIAKKGLAISLLGGDTHDTGALKEARSAEIRRGLRASGLKEYCKKHALEYEDIEAAFCQDRLNAAGLDEYRGLLELFLSNKEEARSARDLLASLRDIYHSLRKDLGIDGMLGLIEYVGREKARKEVGKADEKPTNKGVKSTSRCGKPAKPAKTKQAKPTKSASKGGGKPTKSSKKSAKIDGGRDAP